MKFFTKPYRWGIFYTILLTLASAYTLLDVFLIPKVQMTVHIPDHQDTSLSYVTPDIETNQTTENNNSQSETNTTSSSPLITDTSYQDDHLSINLTTTRSYDSTVYIVDIQTSDPSLLKTALAQNAFGRNIKETTSQMAEDHQAILAINGDYYGFRDDGAVLRNGILYRSTTRQGNITDALLIDNAGNFSIVDETEVDIASMDTNNISQILSFGPTLVLDGQSVISAGDEVDTRSNSLLNPRTAIGMVNPGHYIIIVADGRNAESAGLSLEQLADLFVEQGVQVAYNLNGGGSSSLIFNGQLINQPSSQGRNTEREVSDIVYFGFQ